MVILSHNTPDAIAAYLDRHHLTDLLAGVVGRIHGKPELMKPHPALVHQALELVHASATQVAFIGDSFTDLCVARDTGLRFIGFAKTPRRGHELADAGSEALVDHMQQFADIVRELAPSTQPASQRCPDELGSIGSRAGESADRRRVSSPRSGPRRMATLLTSDT